MKYLRNNLEKDSVVVLGLSGGPDSICLFNLLKQVNNIKLVAAHVNHKVRKESDEEEKFIKQLCCENNIDLEILHLKKIKKGNFEAIARKKRYEFFENVIKKYNAKYLMTAHHGDDLVETILMKIIRGSSIEGYSGIKTISERKNYFIIRPLLQKTKAEIETYNRDNNYKYVVDGSNANEMYTRNRIRHNILPLLKKENELVHLKFKKFSDDIKEINDFLDDYIDKIINKIIKSNYIDIVELLKEKQIVQKRIIYRYLKKEYNNNIYAINSQHVNDVLKMIISDKPNISIMLPLNKKLLKEYKKLYFKHNDEFLENLIEIKKTVNWGNKKIIKVEKSDRTDNNVIYLNSEYIKLPLYVRKRKKGDKIRVKNMINSKKLKDIFINEKIPHSLRDQLPIVVDSDDKILWIPGIKKSYFDSKKEEKYDIILEYI